MEASSADDVVHHNHRLLHVHRELVRVPAQQRIARVGVHRTEHALVAREDNVVLVVVAGEGGVVRLDVQLELVLQVVLAQEADHRLRVVVVLVLRGLARLRLDQQRERGADLLLVVRSHSHEATHVVQLLSGKAVEDALVALATAPEHVVLAAELLGDLHALLHLRGRIGEHVGIRVGGRAVHVDAVAEHVGGAPEELHARLLLLLEHVVGDDIQATVRLL